MKIGERDFQFESEIPKAYYALKAERFFSSF